MKPIPSRIYSVEEAAKDRKTITVVNKEIARKAKPGQFIMVWIPEVDEIPMGLSYIEKKKIAFTVHKVGEATNALHKMKKGDYVGIRGPYGTWFKKVEGKILIVGGGTGIAPLMPLIRELSKNKKTELTIINGAKTAEELLFASELREIAKDKQKKVIFTTDDGTEGIKATATEIAKELFGEQKYNECYACGPEIMIKKMVEISKYYGIHMQASLERYMKCGIGICGSCILDPIGLRVCKDGPVFPIEILEKVNELGKYRRDSAGIKRRV